MKKLFIYLLLIFSSMITSAQSSDNSLRQLYDKANDYYSGSNGVFLNKEKAFDLFKQAAEGGFIPAMKRLSYFYHDGEVVEKDLSIYFKWQLEAAKAGDDESQNIVGVCYHDGKGVASDLEQSFYWIKLAAEKGNIHAMNNLRILYENKGDMNESIKWLRKAAEHGNIESQFDLGIAYQMGKGLKKDPEQAIYWFQFAADNGNAEAYNRIGVIYENDLQDYAKSFFYYNKADEMGSKGALYNLGCAYELGLGTDVDFKLAEQYYLKAISTPGAFIEGSKYRLGMMYYEGKGSVKKDKKKGRKLLQEAAEKGNAKAKEYLEKNKETWSITVNGEKVYERTN